MKFCADELGDAEEKVLFDSWHNTHILCGMAHVKMMFVYFACLLHLSIGHVEGLV